MDNVIKDLKPGDFLYIKAIFLRGNKEGKDLVAEMGSRNPSKQFHVTGVQDDSIDLSHDLDVFRLKYDHFLRIDCAIVANGEVKHDMIVFSPRWFQMMNSTKTVRSLLKTSVIMAVVLAVYFSAWTNPYFLIACVFLLGFQSGAKYFQHRFELVGQIDMFLINRWKEHWFKRKL